MSKVLPEQGEAGGHQSLLDQTAKVSVIGIFLILIGGVLFFAKDFLLPVSLAFLIALVLSPVVRYLRRRGIPEGLSALVLVLCLFAGIGAAAYGLSGPVAQWVADAPKHAREIQYKISSLRRPVEAVVEASKRVEALAESDDSSTQKVVLAEPGLIARAATGAPEAVAKIGLTLVLLLFLLASGDLFYEKLVKSLPTFSDKRRGVRIAREVEREVSRYLLTVACINAGLGIAVGIAMYVVGMPNPALWGLTAAVLNFVPYLGALIGIVVVAAVGLVSYDTLGQALVPPLIYAALTTLEGQLVTPLLVGRRLEMNAVAVFIAVAFWGWLWGIVGAIIAVPMLVVVRIFADHVEGLGALSQFLAARDTPADPEKEDT